MVTLIKENSTELVDWLAVKFLAFLSPILSQNSLKSLQKDSANVAKVQQEVLREILRLQKNTDYGKRYNFSAIQSADEFRKAHPLTTYEDYRSIIDDIANTGNFTQLLAEPVILFQETAGTTGKTKLIPRTKRLLSTHQKGFQAVGALMDSYSWKRKTNTTNGQGLAFTNAKPLNLTPSGIPRGTGTSGGIRQSKFTQNLIRLKFINPPCLFFISDYTIAYYCHLLFGLLEPKLTYISANFASNVLQALQILEQSWTQLVKDIEYGQIDENLELDASTQQELQCLLKPNPERAKVLRTEFEKGFNDILPRIWPQLSRIQCITTGSMQLYKERLKFYSGDIPIYSHGYGASESWIGVNLEPERETPGYVITPHAAFFEFIPVGEVDAELPATVDLTSLAVGESYEIVVTTVAGLYRYRLGDVVKCIDYYNQSPIVEFLYRQGSLLNLYYEKVTENTVFAALTEAIKLLGEDCQIVDYTTRMEIASRPWRYVIYVEVSLMPETAPDLNPCREKLEQVIGDVNETYKELREANRIGSPEVKLVSQDTFESLKNQILKKASSEAQFKMPRLLKNSDLVDFLESRVIH